jgi:mycofactocin precursor
MSIDTAVITPQDALAEQAENEAPVEELLVEEVSIDGMCGVY